MKLNAKTKRDFFSHLIQLVNSVMPDDYRLTWKESEFLTELCLLHDNGGDLGDFRMLSRYFVKEKKLFSSKTQLSLYKTKLANKRWIKSKRDMLNLPKNLIFEDVEYSFDIKLEYVSKE